ncbi:MAG: hypothetical protein ACK5XN_18870 [Bacteroidota bacterium]
MTDKPENPPAFPVRDCAAYQCHGMELRDWFAGMALVGMGQWWPTTVGDYGAKANWAYAQADAMLAERGRK